MQLLQIDDWICILQNRALLPGNFFSKFIYMKINRLVNNAIAVHLLLFTFFIAPAQSTDGWYKVFMGKVGNYNAVLHLHKSAKNYSGYLWFSQNQWPMQLYYNEPDKKTDSLQISASSGPLAIVLTGLFSGDSYTGLSELSKDNGTPKKAAFQLKVSNEKTFTPFGYFYAVGSAKLPPQLKNESQFEYASSAIWPIDNNNISQAYKSEIKQQVGIKTPVTEIGKWLSDEKNKQMNGWKKEYSKLSPKEASEMGMSLSAQHEDRVLVMYENEKNITLAHYSYGYSGGAHGSFATTLSSFSKLSGKKLKLADVVNAAGIQILPKILDQVARVQYGVKNTKPLDQNGFLVNKIMPNENFYLTENGLGFIYAPYAIKSFADGEVNLLVPFTVLKSYLQAVVSIK